MKPYLLFFLLIAGYCSGATYYVDFASGSDANNGTSKSTPWKRHPYMAGWSGSYTHAAGDQYIFKGGVTWDQSCFTMTLQGSGSASAGNDYYGVDQSWFTGGSWSRPAWDRAYALAATDLLNLGNTSYITIDNIEIKRLNTSVTDGIGLINSGGGGGVQTTIKNCYIHGWRTSSSSDGAHGGIIGRTYSASTTWIIDNTEIENSENASIQKGGIAARCVAVFQNGCKIHDNSSAILFCLDFNGSYLYNITGDPFDGVYHCNGIYMDPVSMNQKQGYIRNSFLRNTAGGANMAYTNVRGGATITMYNNVLYGTMSAQGAVEIEPFQYGGEGVGNLIAYNNTICNYSSAASAFHVVTRTGQPVGVLSLYNNHVINAGSLTDAKVGTNANTFNNTTNLVQSASTASSQGYTLSNLYAPTSSSCSTVNAGTLITGLINLDILGISRTQWDIGAYTYGSGNSVSSPPSNAKISVTVP